MEASLKTGVFYTILGYFFFAVASTFAKDLSGAVPASQITFWQFFVTLIGISIAIIAMKDAVHLKIHHPRVIAIRTVAGICSYFLFYYSLRHIPLVDAVLLNTAFPLYVPVIAHFWGGSHINPRLWWGIVIGFIGVIIILRPTPAAFEPSALAGFLGGVFGGIAMVGTRRSTQVESPLAILFYYSLAGSLVFMPWAFLDPLPHSLVVHSELLLVGVSFFMLQFFTTEALEHTSASILAPFSYGAIVFSGLFAWGLWGHTPDALTVLGSLFVVGGAVLTVEVS